MTQLSPEALAGLVEKVRKLLPRVTAGPWRAEPRTHPGDLDICTDEDEPWIIATVCRGAGFNGEAHDKPHADFIALAPTMAVAILALEAQLAVVAKERNAWRQAMQRLTPGGSEFTRPQECEQWAAMLRAELHEAKCAKMRANKVLREIASTVEQTATIDHLHCKLALDRIATLARSLTAPVEK